MKLRVICLSFFMKAFCETWESCQWCRVVLISSSTDNLYIVVASYDNQEYRDIFSDCLFLVLKIEQVSMLYIIWFNARVK